jgi:NAD(P)-dependent dehydrogenase (short-subunit alcohol dehydrogenase family)
MNLSTMEVIHGLRGKNCLVTAASRKLGAAIARRLAQNGVNLAINYFESENAAIDLCAEIATYGVCAYPVQADVCDENQMKKLIDRSEELLGPLHILINNAGSYTATPFMDLPLPEFDSVMNSNLRSTYLASRIVGENMKAAGSGHIINITANSIFFRSHTVYGLAKAAVAQLTESLALELAPQVRINSIAPGLILENEDNDADIVEEVLLKTPIRRLVSREEIADLICLLCTPTLDNFTGHTFIMDGGFHIQG